MIFGEELVLTERQKEIYNYYLKALGSIKERGSKGRKNFEDFDNSQKLVLQKLERFFNTYKHISPYVYFRNVLLYNKRDYMDISEFIKQKAISAYSKYCKQQNDNFADSEESIKSFVDGIYFIGNFCKENNLPLKQYISAVNEAGVNYYVIHLKSHNISLYHLHALGISLSQIPQELREFLYDEFDSEFEKTKINYYYSIKLKKLGNKLKQY